MCHVSHVSSSTLISLWTSSLFLSSHKNVFAELKEGWTMLASHLYGCTTKILKKICYTRWLRNIKYFFKLTACKMV